MKYLIFDFDGVLADTHQVFLQSKITLGRVKNMEESVAHFHAYFDNKPKHTRDHAMSKEELEAFRVRVMENGVEIAKLGFDLFEGFIDEIKLISDKKLAVVSTGSPIYIIERVMATGLQPTHVLTFADHHSKEEKIETICKDWGVSVKDVYYITDSRADVFELENLLDRKKIIGASWGFCGYEKLRDILPEEQVMKEFSDIHKVFDKRSGF